MLFSVLMSKNWKIVKRDIIGRLASGFFFPYMNQHRRMRLMRIRIIPQPWFIPLQYSSAGIKWEGLGWNVGPTTSSHKKWKKVPAYYVTMVTLLQYLFRLIFNRHHLYLVCCAKRGFEDNCTVYTVRYWNVNLLFTSESYVRVRYVLGCYRRVT